MTMPTGLGAVLAIIVLILAILGLLSVVPPTPQIVFGLVGVLAICRLT